MKKPARLITNLFAVIVFCFLSAALQAQITLTTNPHPQTGDYYVNLCPGAPLFFAVWFMDVDPPSFNNPTLTMQLLTSQGDIVTLVFPAGLYSSSIGVVLAAVETTTYSVLSVTASDGQSVTINGPTCFTVIICDEPPENPELDIEITGNLVICTGASTQLTASSVNNGTYEWSTGETTQSITVNTPGVYSVTVTLPCFGSSTASVLVESGEITENISITGDGEILCPQGQTELTAEPGGLDYVWSNGTFAQSIIVNTANTYSVTVTNEFNCSATATASVGAAPLPTVSFSAANPNVCAGACTTVTANFTGTAPFVLSYTTPAGAFTQVFFVETGTFQVCAAAGAPPGSFSVQATALTDSFCTCQ